MDVKLVKVLRLYRSTTHAGEKASARGIVERLLAGTGWTFAEALAALDDPKPSPGTLKETPEEAERRRERAQRRAEIIGRYGSVQAVQAPTKIERAILDALKQWRVADPETGETVWFNGLELDGTLDAEVAEAVTQAFRHAAPWPRDYAEACAEHDMWQARENDLWHVEGDLFGHGLDMAVQLRADAIRDLVNHDMPARSIGDALDRLRRYRKDGSAWRTEMLDAVERDLAALNEAETHPSASVQPAEPALDDVLRAYPSRSDRNIARQFGCSPTTVGKARKRLGIDAEMRSVQRGGQIYRMKKRAVMQ